MTGRLKNFFDRSIPTGHPHIFSKDGRCRHALITPDAPAFVLASVCGFYELENFEPLVSHFEAIANNAHSLLIASILRPASSMMRMTQSPLVEDVMAALMHAGVEIIEQGKVSKKTNKEISKPLCSKGQFYAGARNWWKHI